VRLAWVLWAVFAAVVVIVKYDVAPTHGNVFHSYRETGLRWIAGLDLYPAEFIFNYFPPSAVFMVPWTWLPFEIGGALWRAVNIAVFALGLWHLSAVTASPNSRSQGRSTFPIATLFTIALCWSAARYGQMTLMMAGFMMLAAADVQRGALWRAAIFGGLAVALKPHAIVLLLVLVVIYPRLSWRALLVCTVFALIPFLFQDPGYVWDQYASIPEMLRTRMGQTWRVFAHIFGMFESLGLAITDAQKTIVRLTAAIFVLFLCWQTRSNRFPGSAFFLYALSTCYILLMGAAIEHNTYAMMGPVIGLLAACTWIDRRMPVFVLLCILTAMTVLSHTIMKEFPSYPFLAMLKPFACTILFLLLTTLVWKPRLATKDNSGTVIYDQSVT